MKEHTTQLKKWQILFLLFLSIGTILILKKQQPREARFQHNEGVVFATKYSTTYQCDSSLAADIMQELYAVDQSLSMFNPMSTISRINSGQTKEADSLLIEVMRISREVSMHTHGAFDITVAPLVNAWGFGFKKGEFPTPSKIDSLMQHVGWEKVWMNDNQIERSDSLVIMDLSAVAKGFASDCVAAMFERKGIKNYMIEIGGEIVTSGTNPKGKPWRIGVSRPEDDSTSTNRDIQSILELHNCALATSGNYRNFYIKDGKKISHTIEPRTGYPVQHSLLSSTVIAPNCATADAYATSFMVLGLEEACKVLEAHPEIKAYFIYENEQGQYQTWMSKGIDSLIVNK